MNKLKLMLILVAGGGLLSACDGDGETTVSGMARNQINTATCTSNTAREINNIQYSENDTEINVNTLEPTCSLNGG